MGLVLLYLQLRYLKILEAIVTSLVREAFTSTHAMMMHTAFTQDTHTMHQHTGTTATETYTTTATDTHTYMHMTSTKTHATFTERNTTSKVSPFVKDEDSNSEQNSEVKRRNRTGRYTCNTKKDTHSIHKDTNTHTHHPQKKHTTKILTHHPHPHPHQVLPAA